MNGTAASGRPFVAGACFALLCAAFAVGFFVFPTYPNYDSYYSLLWGRELLDGQTPVFEGFRVPTQHPLAIAAGALLSLAGDPADRLWIAMTFACFLWLVWGIYRLGRDSFTPLVGAIAAALLLTRFDFAFLAARGYIDIPYMALIVWAAVLEGARPRRGTPVFVLLMLAGLLRPEAWLLSGLYFLWMFPRASWPERVKYAVLTWAATAIWFLTDFLVTGDPLFSLHYTSSSAEDLGRQRTLSQLPSAVPYFFSSLIKLPVLLAAGAGLVIATLATPRRMVMPFALFATGLATFFAIGVAGLSVIERYLTVAALALLVFAAVGIGGFTMLRRSRLRTAWMVGAVLLTGFGLMYTLTRVNVDRFRNELEFRGQAHDDLEAVLRSPQAEAALRCGPLTVPNHKLVPDARWILDAPFEDVRPRAEALRDAAPLPDAGLGLVVTSRFALFKHAWTDASDPPDIQLPPEGFDRVDTSRHYAAYARCP
jgi:hypothetical protein